MENATTAKPACAKRLLCAIDTVDLDRAVAVAGALSGIVGGVKLGLEFCTAHGPAGIRAVTECGLPLFLDLKFHDIPNPVAGDAFTVINSSGQPVVIKLFRLDGRLILEEKFGSEKAVIRLNGVPAGIYILSARFLDNTMIFKKMIRE